MPLYAYRCEDCGHIFEQRHGWHDRASACPACTSSSVRRELPTFAVLGSANRGGVQPEAYECTPMGCERPGCVTGVN